MINAISTLDRKTAAGVLARAAPAIDGIYGNPAAAAVLEGEEVLRSELLNEARAHLGISPDDNGEEAIERIADFLDQQAEELVSPPDTDAALQRLRRVCKGVQVWLAAPM